MSAKHDRHSDAPPITLDRMATLSAISAASLDAVIAVDHDGSIIGWNSLAEECFGWTSAEALGLSIHQTIIPERDRAAHILGLQRFKNGDRSNIFGTRFNRMAVRADGAEIPIELSIMCIGNAEDDLLVCFVRDLSEQVRSQQAFDDLQLRLLHVSRISAMGTMAATLAHELNQPLAAATNYLSATITLLERGAEADISNAKLGVESGRAAVARAAETIRSVRDMVDRRPRQGDAFKVRTLARDAIGLLGGNLTVKPKIEVQPGAEWVLTNKVQFEQILINLLRNAGDATRETPAAHIRLTAQRDGDEVIVRVIDNGPGIAEDRMEDLFSTFRSTKPTGMGMGLSICRTLVEQSSGRMWVESKEGEGATFSFTVPAADQGVL